MLPQRDSSSNSPNPSACSSDSSNTGDVLIRSTRVRHEAGPGPGSLKITVQKMRDSPVHLPETERQQRNTGTERQQRPKPRQNPDSAALRAAESGKRSGSWSMCTDVLSRVKWLCVRACVCADRRTLNKPAPSQDNRVSPPPQTSEPSLDRKHSVRPLCETHSQLPTGENPNSTHHVINQSSLWSIYWYSGLGVQYFSARPGCDDSLSNLVTVFDLFMIVDDNNMK